MQGLRRLVAGALCAAIAACAGQTAGPGGTESAESTFDDQSMSAQQQQGEAAMVTPHSPSEPQQAAIDPESLVGMTGQRISGLFGTPIFVRRDPPGEFWRYRGETCVLELFFYPQDGAQRVDHIETRTTGNETPDRAKCVAKLRKPAVPG
ncbi:unnamed protein product [Laminaria digitata]